jgi:hypothetical protein
MAWTSRTPNSLAFVLCAIGLSVGALSLRSRYAVDAHAKSTTRHS